MLTEVSGAVVGAFIDPEHNLLFGGRDGVVESNICFGYDVVEAMALSICIQRFGCNAGRCQLPQGGQLCGKIR